MIIFDSVHEKNEFRLIWDLISIYLNRTNSKRSKKIHSTSTSWIIFVDKT